MTDTKYVIVLIDGAADLPIARLGGRTPLMVARKPTMDALAAGGRCGTLETVPEGLTPDSAVANLSVLGYDPRRTYQGRGVLEAASMGIELGAHDVALRCNLICTEAGAIVDHSAGHIGTAEARALIDAVDETLGVDRFELYPGVAYRHLAVLRGEEDSPALECFPPHDNVGRPVAELKTRALAPEAEETAALLWQITEASTRVLAEHPINRARRAAGKREATSLWFWAPGRKPHMETLDDRFGVRGAVISAVDLIRGLGRYAGLDVCLVEGATGLFDTNYEGKARAALAALDDHDLAFVHVEGADEAGHSRDLGLKIHCVESIDRRLLRPLLAGMEGRGWRPVIAVLPDHLTPVERGDHVAQPVPVLIHDPDRPADAVQRYDEISVCDGALGALVGDGFIRELLWRELQQGELSDRSAG